MLKSEVKSKLPLIGVIGLALFAIVFSAFIHSPFTFFDEQTHYARAIEVANGKLLQYKIDDDESKYGGVIDKASKLAIDDYASYVTENPIRFNWLDTSKYGRVNSGETEENIHTNTAPYTPLPYFQYAPAVVISKLFNTTVSTRILLMRITGGIICLAIMVLAYFVFPYRKKAFLAFLLLPSVLNIFSSISADGFTIAVSILFIAFVTRLIVNEKKISKIDFGALSILSVFVTLAKMPAFLLVSLILVLIINKWKLYSTKAKIALSGLIAGNAAITLLWAKYSSAINTGAYWGKDVSTSSQLSFVLHNPLSFGRALVNTLLRFDYHNIVYQSYGNGWQFFSFPTVISLVVLIGVFLSLYDEVASIKQKKFTIACYPVIFCGIILSIFVLLYLQFNNIGYTGTFEGVQSRYFLPYLPLLLLIPMKFSSKPSKLLKTLGSVLPILGCVFFLFYLFVQIFFV